ncbi:MAG: TRAP transporter small permease [Oscillospiraceae bacterium]|nr:TRAP transporter small permease [Oscillospiraceae bacterium]
MKRKITPMLILKNLDAIITGTTLTLCVILVNINVLMRYFLNAPLQWSEEIVTSLFVWTVFIGSAYAYRKHAHLGVDIVVKMIPGNAQRVFKIVMGFLELLILIMLTWISADYVGHLIFSRTGEIKIMVTDLLRLPKWWTGIAVPAGFGLSTLYAVWFMLTEKFNVIQVKKTEEGMKGGREE